MKGHAAAAAPNAAKRLLKSKHGVKAIANALCQSGPAIDAREARSSWIAIAKAEAQALEDCQDYSLRFQSAHCLFAELRASVALPSIMAELLGFQMLKGARLAEKRESAALKNAMACEKEQRAKKKEGVIQGALDLALEGLLDGKNGENAPDAPSNQPSAFRLDKAEALLQTEEGFSRTSAAAGALARAKRGIA